MVFNRGTQGGGWFLRLCSDCQSLLCWPDHHKREPIAGVTDKLDLRTFKNWYSLTEEVSVLFQNLRSLACAKGYRTFCGKMFVSHWRQTQVAETFWLKKWAAWRKLGFRFRKITERSRLRIDWNAWRRRPKKHDSTPQMGRARRVHFIYGRSLLLRRCGGFRQNMCHESFFS